MVVWQGKAGLGRAGRGGGGCGGKRGLVMQGCLCVDYLNLVHHKV